MQVELGEIRNVLNQESLNRVETQISEKLGASIYKEDLPVLVQLMKKEIDLSGISIDVISEFIDDNESIIVEFALLLLKKRPAQILSIGVSITYSIYLILLQRENDVLLEEYLDRRRIPGSIMFLKQLKDIGIKMGI